MIGPLYYRIRDPEQIKKMPYYEMKYWNTWNESIDKETQDQMNGLNLEK